MHRSMNDAPIVDYGDSDSEADWTAMNKESLPYATTVGEKNSDDRSPINAVTTAKTSEAVA